MHLLPLCKKQKLHLTFKKNSVCILIGDLAGEPTRFPAMDQGSGSILISPVLYLWHNLNF